jgi:Prokaryotic RING finger family 4
VRVTTTTTAVARPRTVAAVLLSRRGLVYLPDAPARPGPSEPGAPGPVVAAGVILLEADLLDRGLLMSAALRDHLERLDIEQLGSHGAALLADVDDALGADRPMVPLFRGFPGSVPADTMALWVNRVLTLLFQYPDQPCVLCGTIGEVHAVSPCAHLVCRACFDGSNYSGCPICHRRIDVDDPFLQPAAPRGERGEPTLPQRARVVSLGMDSTADARAEVAALLARPSALSPQDTADLLALLVIHSLDDLSWLPAVIPGRETKARVLAWLLNQPVAAEAVGWVLATHLGTATDVLRLLAVHSGGDAGLLSVLRFQAVPRAMRRHLLAALDRMDPRSIIEDLNRHRLMWTHLAERLHPFEYARRFPTAAAAFAALRGTALSADALGALVRQAAERGRLEIRVPSEPGPARVSRAGHAARLEEYLAAANVPAALNQLGGRPGEFLRRLDHLMRIAAAKGDSALVRDALPAAAAGASPAVLLSSLGALRVRASRHDRRVFFPKGGNAKVHVVDDVHPPLPRPLVDEVTTVLTAEVLARCGRLPAVDTALIDESLQRLIAPFTQRTASRALITVPRGSALPVPDGRYLRLFLHWMQSTVTVDLDLSVAFFDGAWQHIGTCDYTQLRWPEASTEPSAAVHSGDLTSAPPPLGASEFLDLDVDALLAAGARHVVAAVFSYNNVAFNDMAEAFAGVMLRGDDPAVRPVFDTSTVEQRFDLAGRARACVPFVIDLATRTMRWLDVAQGVTGTFHAVHRHHDALALLGESLSWLYTSGARITMGELATWHAAARADVVLVRCDDGVVHRFLRSAGEDVPTFAGRILAGTPDSVGSADEITPVPLAFLIRGDAPVAAGADVYALYPAGLDTTAVRLLAAADLAASLAPIAAPVTVPVAVPVAVPGGD